MPLVVHLRLTAGGAGGCTVVSTVSPHAGGQPEPAESTIDPLTHETARAYVRQLVGSLQGAGTNTGTGTGTGTATSTATDTATRTGSAAEPPEHVDPVLLVVHADPGLPGPVDWERLPGELAVGPRAFAVRVVRSDRGPEVFHPHRAMADAELPVRVLMVGVKPETAERAGHGWHEDFAVHRALGRRPTRWEVDVHPEPVTVDELAEHLCRTEPGILHLAGDALRTLLDADPDALARLNLYSVRLVVATGESLPAGEQPLHELVRGCLDPGLPQPALAAVTLTGPEPGPGEDCTLCDPVGRLYGELAAGTPLDSAVTSILGAYSGTDATVTVNCAPDQVLPLPEAQEPVTSTGLRMDDLYERLEMMTDRVPKRRQLLDQLHNGTDSKQLIVVSGPEAKDCPPAPPRGTPEADMAGAGRRVVGTTSLVLSVLRVWEARGRRALYLNLGNLEEENSGGEPIDPGLRILLGTVRLLVHSAEQANQRYGGQWDIDPQLTVARDRLAQQTGLRNGNVLDRQEVEEIALELLVNLTPPDAPLILAIDHHEEIPQADEQVRELFKKVIALVNGLSVVVVARTLEESLWLSPTKPQLTIKLKPWEGKYRRILARENLAKNGKNWHREPWWSGDQGHLAHSSAASNGSFWPEQVAPPLLGFR